MSQKKKNNGTAVPQPGVVQLDYGHLKQKYGPDVSETTEQLEVMRQMIPGFKIRIIKIV